MKIVITGATGFVGSNLARRFVVDGHKVFLIVRPESSLEIINDLLGQIYVFKFSGELNSLISFFEEIKPEIVFHLASLFIAEHQSSDVDLLIKSNVLFATQILEAMNKAGIRKLINTGTSWQHYNNEDYNPVCLYAATKQAFEAIIKYYVESEEFKVITLKLFDTYGEDDHRSKLVNLLNKFAREQTELKFSPGDQELILEHVSDVCEAYNVAIEEINKHDFTGHRRYAVGGDVRYKLKEVISLFEEISGQRVNAIWGGRSYRKREVMSPWSNFVKLPGWQPKVSLKEGFERIIEKER